MAVGKKMENAGVGKSLPLLLYLLGKGERRFRDRSCHDLRSAWKKLPHGRPHDLMWLITAHQCSNNRTGIKAPGGGVVKITQVPAGLDRWWDPRDACHTQALTDKLMHQDRGDALRNSAAWNALPMRRIRDEISDVKTEPT